MKKLVTICLILTTTCTINAQTKATKDETIAYLDKVLKMSIGYKTNLTPGYEVTVTGTFFSFEKIEVRTKDNWADPATVSNVIKTYTRIHWESFNKIDTMTWKLMDPQLILITVCFDVKLRYDAVSVFPTNTSEVCMSDDMHYPNCLTFAVQKTKAESFKKGIERLVEIAEEENQDRFDK